MAPKRSGCLVGESVILSIYGDLQCLIKINYITFGQRKVMVSSTTNVRSQPLWSVCRTNIHQFPTNKITQDSVPWYCTTPELKLAIGI